MAQLKDIRELVQALKYEDALVKIDEALQTGNGDGPNAYLLHSTGAQCCLNLSKWAEVELYVKKCFQCTVPSGHEQKLWKVK